MALIQWLIDQAQHNQIFSGVAGVSIIGGVFYWLRALPNRIGNTLAWGLTSEAMFTSDDIAYQQIIRWLSPYMIGWQIRSYRPMGLRDPNADDQDGHIAWTMTPGVGVHWFWWRGWPYRLNRDMEAPPAGGGIMAAPRETIRIRAMGWSKDRLFQLLDEAQRDTATVTKTQVYCWQGWWRLVDSRIPRPVESVILPEGMLEQVIGDLKRFFIAHKYYIERGIPYRRGYLLHGVPGTGKSSFALALAGHFSTPLHVISLSSLGSDSELFNALAMAPRRSFVLIEDIDAANVSNKRAPMPAPQPTQPTIGGNGPAAGTPAQQQGITLSGLLNALDGVMAKEGRVLLMTTNHIDQLDPALIRPGRIDLQLSFGLADKEQAKRLFARFFDDSGLLDEIERRYETPRSPAEIQEICLRHHSDGKAAAAALVSSPISRIHAV